MAFAASFKTVAFSQNSLRPFEIQKNYFIINFSNQGGARAKPETPALYANWRIRGAKLSLFGGAIKACVAGGQKGLICRFRRPFFGSFFGRTKKERKGLWRSKRTDPPTGGELAAGK